MTGLIVEDLNVDLGGRPVVKNASFAAQPGELVGLIGANGVGKSTLLRAVANLIPAKAGQVSWNGQSVFAMPLTTRARTLAYLPQGQSVHWGVSVRHLVALGRLPYLGPFSRMSASEEQAVDRAMARADVVHLADKSALELSGGERSRVLLARALAVEAPVLMVDEPTAALDIFHQLQTLELLQELAAHGTLILAVLHDLSLAARFCSRILLMNEGVIVGDGTPRDVLTEEALAASYRVQAFRFEHDNQMLALPWKRLG